MSLRQRSPRQNLARHLSFVRELSCAVSGHRGEIDAAHIRYSESRYGKFNPGVGQKPHDFWTVPLWHHLHVGGLGAQHSSGERKWWEQHGIDPCLLASLLWIHTGDHDSAERVLKSARAGLLKGCFA